MNENEAMATIREQEKSIEDLKHSLNKLKSKLAKSSEIGVQMEAKKAKYNLLTEGYTKSLVAAQAGIANLKA